MMHLSYGFMLEIGLIANFKGTQRTHATVNRYTASLSIVLAHAVKVLGWISTNPVIRVPKLKGTRGRSRVLSQNECNRLLASCEISKSSSLLLIVTLAITTGMRQGEILKLTWNDVDLHQGIIFLKETKNNKPPSVPIVGSALEQIKK